MVTLVLVDSTNVNVEKNKKKRNNSEAKSHFGQSVSALLSSLLSSVCVGGWVLKVNVLQCYSFRVSSSTVDRDGYT